MKLRILIAATAVALAACTTPTDDLDRAQKRAVAAIQTGQRESTAALVAGTITVSQDRAAQAKLLAARQQVLASKSAAEALQAASAAGVTP